jgi:hypothetical protein
MSVSSLALKLKQKKIAIFRITQVLVYLFCSTNSLNLSNIKINCNDLTNSPVLHLIIIGASV